MTFDYQHVDGYDTNGNPSPNRLPGFEEFDGRVHSVANSPDHSVDEELTDLFDVNSDGLPDILVTAPALFGGKHGVFFNGAGGKPDTFGQDSIAVIGVGGATATDITLKNLNLTPQDIDGDGTIDLLHMPAQQTYSVYTPVKRASGWIWQGRVISTASGQNPKIDFGKDALDTKSIDVNGDGLVDTVFSGGTGFQTFFSLGRYPGGDGQFGHARWTGPRSATISNDPVVTCVPWDGTPVRFSDPDIKLGDMNGDGFTDIVRIHEGDIRYWPGRGNGFWGTGRLDDCPGDSFGQRRDILMTSSPPYSDVEGESLRLDDVNGDGLDDLVQVRFDAVDVWLNVDGRSWTDRHVIAGTPSAPSFANRVRLVDMNGSGTRDILWGDGLKYKYIDLAGGQRPWVLTHVANGLGKTTDVEYSTSTAMMLAAEAKGPGSRWNSTAPMPLHVVSRITEQDHLGGVYVTEYTYRDPVYDGRQREFRGFRHAETRKIGDDNSPTSTTSTDFLLGECKDDDTGDDIDPCSSSGRWLDSGREALKGLPVLTETFDETSVFLSTSHSTYRLRHLYAGLDGRLVRHAFVVANDTYLYDTAPFVPADRMAQATSLTDVESEFPVQPSTGASPMFRVENDTVGKFPVQARSASRTAHLHTGENESPGGAGMTVDFFGNSIVQTDWGCVAGCDTQTADESIETTTVAGRPDGDTTGWLWRTMKSFVTGNQHRDVKRNENEIQYNPAGDQVLTRMVLSGTVPLDRHHDTFGRAFSEGPPAASSGIDEAVIVTVMEQSRDEFGNVFLATAANGRCREISYDAPFKQLATSESVFVGSVVGSCGNRELSADANYDRSIMSVVAVHDLHRELTLAAYDQFGHLTSRTRPDPNVLGSASPLPSVKLEYFFTADADARPYSILHTQTQDGVSLDSPEYHDTWEYVDGFGRTIVTLAESDPASQTEGIDFIASGQTDYDKKGAARRKYLPYFHSGDPKNFPVKTAPTTAYGRQRYDAFGRQFETFGLDGTITLRTLHHALSKDLSDAADLLPGPHQGTFATMRKDGHGRDVGLVERIHVGSAIEARETSTKYLPTGEPEVITRVRVGRNDPVVRWMRYDNQGRRVLNVEPNTTTSFNPDPTTDLATLRAWRYAYNDAGDLVGTSDARGCGVDYHYEGGGRLIGEDYSPCVEKQLPYTTANPSTKTGFEVLYQYDAFEATDGPPVEAGCRTDVLEGRIVSVSDRASKTLTCYDGRGRTTAVARKIAKPTVDESPEDRYTARWYVRRASFDAADRPIVETTGAQVPALMGAGGQSRVTTHYSPRGMAKSVEGSYGTLIANLVKDADGLTRELKYGDIAETTTSFNYDNRRRLSSVQTYRGPPPLWTNNDPTDLYDGDSRYSQPNNETFQLLLQDQDFSYDNVDNPIEIRDWRIPDEWPEGARPVTRKMKYDDLYRLSQVDYEYAGGSDAWVDPFAAEGDGTTPIDPRRSKPSPHVSFDRRVQRQNFTYDWLGNTSTGDDDAHGFYDRSLGTITNGTANAGPYQLKSASNETASPPTVSRQGKLSVAYDASGNMTKLALRRSGPCVGAANCTQGFVYDWDEVGRLVEARRWELSGAPGTADLPPPENVGASVDLKYAYDASDARVIKTSTSGTDHVHTLYVFGSLELRRARFDTEAPGDYDLNPSTEVPYLTAGGVRLARVAFEAPETGVPRRDGLGLHVFLELGDQLGSTSVVLDKATSELVEAATYQAYGSAEIDYRPEKWDGFREDYRFSGKEDDVEVGLTYFGARFYVPALGRWASPDPLAVHGSGGDLNLYAYVEGRVLKLTDPVGLEPTNDKPDAGTDGSATPPPPEPPPPADKDLDAGAEGHVDLPPGGTELPHEYTEKSGREARHEVTEKLKNGTADGIRGARAGLRNGGIDTVRSANMLGGAATSSMMYAVPGGSIVPTALKYFTGSSLPPTTLILDQNLASLRVEPPQSTAGMIGYGYGHAMVIVGTTVAGMGVSATLEAREAALFQRAFAARDDAAAAIRLLPRREAEAAATVVGGYSRATGEVTVGTKWYSGARFCAENVVERKLGGNLSDIVMTPAIKPWTLRTVEACQWCQLRYSSNFAPATYFEPVASALGLQAGRLVLPEPGGQ
jgi:RHS repeat-associated protein